MVTKFNLNDIVRVKLTEKGRHIYKEFYKDHPSLIKIDNDNCIETELWSIMQIFGGHLYMGSKPLFDKNEIILI